MKIRLLKKQLKERGLTISSLLKFWDDAHGERHKNKNVYLPSTTCIPSSQVFIFKSELDYISRCILDYKNIETGGQLFGYWTAEGSPVVVYAIGPGKKANHQVAFFNQDIDYLINIGTLLVKHYGLHHIGEWHSHHQLGLAHPSGHDASTMADSIKKKNLGRFLLCIGNCNNSESTLNAFNFTQDYGYNFTKAQWCVYDIQSPYREIIDKELAGLLTHPSTKEPNYKDRIFATASKFTTYEESNYWFAKKENRLVLKDILDYLRNTTIDGSCSVQMDEKQHVHILVKRDNRCEHIYFPQNFPFEAPIISQNQKNDIMRKPWEFDGNLLSSFIQYYKSIVNYDGQ